MDKDAEGLVKVGSRLDVLRVMRETNDYAQRGCNIVSLIKEYIGGGELDIKAAQCILRVRNWQLTTSLIYQLATAQIYC